MDKETLNLLERLRKKQQERIAEMQRLRDSGMTYEEIGRKFGVSRQQIFKLLKKANEKK